ERVGHDWLDSSFRAAESALRRATQALAPAAGSLPMRPTFFYRILAAGSIVRPALAGLAFCAMVQQLAGQGRLTMLAEFERPPDPTTVEWMEQEAAELFLEAGVAFTWQLPNGN